MTKTQTEKWKDMDLADDHLYYWRMPNGEVRIMNKLSICSYKLCYDGGYIYILAPVPSYDEWKKLDDELKELATKNDTICMENGRLQEKLAIATKALKEYADRSMWEMDGFSYMNEERAEEALKEIKEVK